jgi:hypothetical protein
MQLQSGQLQATQLQSVECGTRQGLGQQQLPAQRRGHSLPNWKQLQCWAPGQGRLLLPAQMLGPAQLPW